MVVSASGMLRRWPISELPITAEDTVKADTQKKQQPQATEEEVEEEEEEAAAGSEETKRSGLPAQYKVGVEGQGRQRRGGPGVEGAALGGIQTDEEGGRIERKVGRRRGGALGLTADPIYGLLWSHS